MKIAATRSIFVCECSPGLYKAHAHDDYCEAIHARACFCGVGVCVWACTRSMGIVITARRYMRVLVCVVWECVFGLVQGSC
jgi:hypothetical protein